MRLETIKIKHFSGYCLINKVDFDSSQHQLFEVAKAKEEKVKTEEKTLINLNTADKKTLISLPRIGAKTAEDIINARPFKSIEEAISKFKGLEDLQEMSDLTMEV